MSALEAPMPAPVPQILTVAEAADVARRHVETVRDALRAGELHGSQRSKGAAWRVQYDCAVAWALGELCAHQRERRAPVSLSSFRARGGAS